MQYTFDGELVKPVLGDVGESECHNCGMLGAFDREMCAGTEEVHCEDCVVNHCDNCSVAECGEDDWHYTPDRVLCERCFDIHYTHCVSCEDVLSVNDVYETSYSYNSYCQDCFYERYTGCGNCDITVGVDETDMNGNCESCSGECGDEGHEYNYTPTPKFHGHGNVFMGVELEVDKSRTHSVSELVDNLTALDMHEDDFYLKHDGSLDDGLEIVSHPATLKAHMRDMKWDKVIEVAKSFNFKSHDAGTCGLHVHVGRTGLGNTRERQENTIDNLIAMFWKLESELFAFSRRKYGDLDQWAAFNHNQVSDFDPKKAHRGKSNDNRYRAINVTNQHTVEFRLFRGTLKLSTFKATIQLVDTLVRIAQDYSLAYIINKLTWGDVVTYDRKNKELLAYDAITSDGD